MNDAVCLYTDSHGQLPNMEISALIVFGLIQYELLLNVLADDGHNHCMFIELSNTWFHRDLEGVYKMKIPGYYHCNNRSVYQLDKGNSYLYYIQQGSWEGWMVGNDECVNKGYLSVSDRAQYPEDIKATWEEYNSLKWLFNEDIISGCHIPGVTRPPRMKTKPPKTTTTSSPSNGTTLTLKVSQCSKITQTLPFVFYIVVPIGSLVIIGLLLILGILTATHVSFLKTLQRQQNAV